MTSETKLPSLASWRIPVAVLLCLANAVLAGLLLMQHHGESGAVAAVNEVCGESAPGAPSGCDTVARSSYSKVAGLPLAAYGLFFSLAVAVLLLLSIGGAEVRLGIAALAFLAVALAFAVDLVLAGILAFAIKAVCWFCVATYLVNAAVLVIVLPVRRALDAARGLTSAPAGRLVLTCWVVAALALGAGVYATEIALRARERVRAATLLGAPSPDATATSSLPTPTAPEGTELRRFQEEARAAAERANKLQETLDDPEKLNLYFTQKADREYEAGPTHSLKLEGVPRKGPENAPIKVVEFSDFMCPYCRNLAGAFEGFLPQSGGRIVLYFKNYPLDMECNSNLKQTVHVGACLLARGGICAQEQGKFWPYHNRVFSQELRTVQRADVLKMAGEAGLEVASLESCMDGARTRERLTAEIAEAAATKLAATPTLFIDGKKLPRIQDFMATLDKESKRRGLPPLPTTAR
jgi:protein-disulfide isomerase/uncharacterized membrane protein